MKFGQISIWVISLFWIIPIMAVFYLYSFKKKKRLIEMFCKDHLKIHIMPKQSERRQWIKAFLIILSVLFMIFALMRPRWGFHWEEIKRVGVDLIVAVDCSQSMMATDVQPNRLERAKREIQDLLRMLDGDRIGLVAFAGTSFVQCPLTLDYGAFRIFLDYLDTDLIPLQGTALGQAIRECIGSFDRTQKGSKAIILITDGEDHEGDPLEVAFEAKQKGIKIFPIGIGKEGGAPIPLEDGSGFKKDRQGNLILSKLDEKTLQRIALETGGSYVRSVTGDLDLEKIYLEGIKSLDQKELASTKKRIWEERFQWFLFLSFLFLIIEQILSEYRRIRIKKIDLFLFLIFICPLIILILGSAATVNSGIIPSSKAKEAQKLYTAEEYDQALSVFLDAQIDSPEDPILHYNIANTYYKMNNYEEASKNYQSAALAAKDIELEEKAYYNLGNCSYRMGKLDEAIIWYKKALDLNPDDEDAKYNLEFVREEIKRRINQAKEQQEKQEKDGEEESQRQQEENQSAQANQGEAKSQQQQQQEENGEQGKQEQSAQTEKDPNQEGQIKAMEQDDKARPDKDREEPKSKQGQAMRKISREEAERLLESLDEGEKKASPKQRIPGSGRYTPDKDW
jgi:Ca-activated chloride channel family protein